MSPLFWESSRNVLGVSSKRCRECVWERWNLSGRGVICLGEVEDAGEMWNPVWERYVAVEISGRVNQGGWWGHGDFGGRAKDLWRSLAEGHNGRELGAVITVDRAG